MTPRDPETVSLPLSGYKVVEYATYIAAPACGCMMSDWGADVIKLESLSGDPNRDFLTAAGLDSGPNPMFDLDNRGKRSIAVDTQTSEGKDILVRLAQQADVFLTNVRPGGLARSGLDYESLSKINPKLVYASITGYGLEGPEKDRPGFDATAFWCRTGMARLTAQRGADPLPIRTGFGDHVTSMAMLSGVLAALLESGRTGRGRLVESSLVRSAFWAMGSDVAIQLGYGRIASSRPRNQQNNPLANFFKTGDGHWIVLYARGQSDWEKLCAIVGRAELPTQERFLTSADRKRNKAELIEALDAAFAEVKYADCIRMLDEQDLVWGPVQTLAEAIADPQVRASGAIVDTPDGKGGFFEAPAGPIRFPGIDDGPKGPTPLLGEHTHEILSGLGYDDDDVARLTTANVVKAHNR